MIILRIGLTCPNMIFQKTFFYGFSTESDRRVEIKENIMIQIRKSSNKFSPNDLWWLWIDERIDLEADLSWSWLTLNHQEAFRNRRRYQPAWQRWNTSPPQLWKRAHHRTWIKIAWLNYTMLSMHTPLHHRNRMFAGIQHMTSSFSNSRWVWHLSPPFLRHQL